MSTTPRRNAWFTSRAQIADAPAPPRQKFEPGDQNHAPHRIRRGGKFGMQGFGREVWLSRWVVVRQWLIGAVTALSAIAVWAVTVWLGVVAIQASGMLPPSVAP